MALGSLRKRFRIANRAFGHDDAGPTIGLGGRPSGFEEGSKEDKIAMGWSLTHRYHLGKV